MIFSGTCRSSSVVCEEVSSSVDESSSFARASMTGDGKNRILINHRFLWLGPGTLWYTSTGTG